MPIIETSRVRPNQLMTVDVDVGGDRPGRDRRMFREVFGTEQALLLGGHESEVDRAPGRLRQIGERPRDRENRRDAGGVVERAVVDGVVAGLGAVLDAEVVVVRRIEDGLARELRVAAPPHSR